MTQGWMIFIVGQALATIMGVLKIYLDMSIKLNELDIRVKQAENKDDVIFKKLDQISAQIQQLSIDLQNKQDK